MMAIWLYWMTKIKRNQKPKKNKYLLNYTTFVWYGRTTYVFVVHLL